LPSDLRGEERIDLLGLCGATAPSPIRRPRARRRSWQATKPGGSPGSRTPSNPVCSAWPRWWWPRTCAPSPIPAS